VKRKRKISSEKLVWSIENYVFTQVTKNVFFPKKKKYGNIECLDIHPKKYSDFFEILKCVFSSGCMCTYEAKLISPIHDLIFRKQTQEICTPSGIFNFQTKIT
jgi:hypothetical protein